MPDNKTFERLPDRHDNWTLASEGFVLTTRLDYHGQPYNTWIRPVKNLTKAWQQFSEGFRSQEERPLTGHNSYNPPMDRIDFYNIENPNKI